MAATGYTPILIYASGTAAAVPLAADLTTNATTGAELAINYTDGKLYYKNNSGTVTLLASTSGASGDVVGPASATDNALARFDLTTGKLIQNSVGILSDAGILTGLTGITSSGSITFSSLTSGRVTYAGTAGLLQDSANLTFNGTTLTANTIGAYTLSGTIAGGGNQINNVIIGTSTPLAGSFTTINASTSITNAGLTSGRVTFAGASGLLSDSTKLTFDTSNLTVGVIGLTANADGATGKLVLRKPNEALGNNQFTRMLDFAPYYPGFDEAVVKASIFSGVDTGTQNGQLGFMTATGGVLSEKMRILADGSVGIGTGTPSGLLNIKGTNGQLVLANGNTSGGMRITATNVNYTANGYLAFEGYSSEYGRFDASGQLSVGTTSAFARLTTSQSPGSAGQVNGQIAMTHAGATTAYFISTIRGAATNEPEGLTFKENATERMRITSVGNVGINESNPPYQLTVAGTGYFQGPASDTAGLAGVFINYGNAAGVVKRFLCLNGNGVTNAALGLNQIDANNGDLVISTLGSGTLTERIRLTYQGNFLLGTTTATANYNFVASQSLDTTIGIMVENLSNTVSASAAVRYKNSDASINAFTGIGSPTRAVYGGLGPNVTFFYTSSTAGMTLMVDQAGPITFCNGSPIAEQMRLDSSGNLLVGLTTNTAGSKMAVSSSGITIYGTGYRQIYMNGNVLSFFNGSNEATLTNAGVWTNASDSRLKKNITNIKYGLNTVLITQPRSFERNDVEGNYIGFIAQELKEHIPEVVYGEKQLSVDYGSLVAVAFKAIQEQQALIESLTTRLTALENK